MRQAAYSLLELMMALALASVVLVAGIPNLRWLVLDDRRTADINALVTSIHLARSESAKRATAVTICRSRDQALCGDADTRFDSGWIVFVDFDEDSPPQRDGGEPVLFSYSPRSAGTIRSNRGSFRFQPNYRRSTNGTVTFCDARGAESARAVIISYTGRPRVADTGPGGRALACPG